MAYHYAFQGYNKDTMARCVTLAASVSTKQCIEIASRLRGRNISAGKRILKDAISLTQAIPFKRFNDNVGHKKVVGPGRYAVNACKEVLRTLEGCEANAQDKGLATGQLRIRHISANLASRPWHYGRQRRRRMKRSHIEIVLEETGAPKSAQPKATEKPIAAEPKPTEKTIKAKKPKNVKQHGPDQDTAAEN
jgi:large subunit ribosomal protein L22